MGEIKTLTMFAHMFWTYGVIGHVILCVTVLILYRL